MSKKHDDKSASRPAQPERVHAYARFLARLIMNDLQIKARRQRPGPNTMDPMKILDAGMPTTPVADSTSIQTPKTNTIL